MTRTLFQRPARVLVVDDERRNRELLALMLEPEGMEIYAAENGEEALAVIAQRPPDLVLLDLTMPGLDGYEVTRRLKGDPATENIPIIILTALDGREVRLRGLSAGAEDFLTKPVDREELRVRVRNLLRLKAYGDFYDRYSQVLEGEVGQRQADLVERERLYRATFETAPVGIAHVDHTGRWLRVNQRLCDLLGYDQEALQRITVQTLIDPDDVAKQLLPFAKLAAGQCERHTIDELRYRRGDGGHVWARCSVSAHRGADGAFQHFIAAFEDITERRTLEAQIRQASKMDAIGRLASGVAHDFNNLLTVILGFADLMVVDPGLATRHREDLREITKAAGRASSLTGQLLAFSRQQVLHAAPLDLNELITEMTGMLDRLIGARVTVVLALAPALSLATADRSQLEQVVMNLVVNARDAMPEGGVVTISTRDFVVDELTPEDEVDPMLRGRYVQLLVTDTGGGMTAETRRRLFEPFYTTKEAGKGTGLGLSTTYGIVKQSRGHIAVRSAPADGTTFTVSLPRSEGQIATPVVTPPSRSMQGMAETVLLVEDEVGVRALSKRILDSAGYVVLEAVNGDDAERVFAEHVGPIDLVVTDLVMPGCGGFELLARLKVHAPHLRVLYMSGYADEFPILETTSPDSAPFMQKPFTATELVRQVRSALDR